MKKRHHWHLKARRISVIFDKNVLFIQMQLLTCAHGYAELFSLSTLCAAVKLQNTNRTGLRNYVVKLRANQQREEHALVQSDRSKGGTNSGVTESRQWRVRPNKPLSWPAESRTSTRTESLNLNISVVLPKIYSGHTTFLSSFCEAGT